MRLCLKSLWSLLFKPPEPVSAAQGGPVHVHAVFWVGLPPQRTASILGEAVANMLQGEITRKLWQYSRKIFASIKRAKIIVSMLRGQRSNA